VDTALAIGTDLVRIARWEKHATDECFLRRAFTDAEIALCAGNVSSLAGRWAVKEAVLKALGAGLGSLPLTDIETGRDDDGRPLLTLHGKAREWAHAAGLRQWQASISHDGEYAIAMVLGRG
jgi:holo-[acyl-carrier protein] synthase